MATHYYITFHSSTYDTAKRYSSCLQILSKDNLVAIGEDISLKIPMSWSKEKMADYISSYVVSHSEEMVAILDDEEIVLAHNIIAGGKGTVLWKRHLLKYHHLKCMVWVVVNTANRGKDGFMMLDEISEAFAPYIEQRYGAAQENMKSAKSKASSSRFYLRDLKSKLDGLDIDQLKYLHLLFEMNYMEDSDFCFGDEWFEDGYHDCFYDWYHNGCKETPYDLNQMVFEILEEWKERGYKRYRPAMDSIRDWCSRKWTQFESEHQAEVSAAYDAAIVHDEEKEISRSLYPFIHQVHEYIRNKQYQEAISLIFCLFDQLGKACRKHQNWFESYWRGGVQTSVVLFLDVLRHLYCHLRQHPDIPWQLKEAMDLHLLLTNKQHRLFGDLELAWGDSRMEDMLSDESSYCDYSNMEDELCGYLERMLGQSKPQ